jgi:hypothetical protein
MRPELRNWLGELTAGVTPAVYRILNIAAVAIGETEIVFSGVENPVQLVLRLVLGKPVTLVLSKIRTTVNKG